MKPSLFDIIIPLYNTNIEYFKKCIKSILNQTDKNFNVIIVNDCSTNEELLEYYRSLKNPIIHFEKIDNEKNMGTFITRIRGIQNSVSKYIIWVDPDDYIVPNTIETLHKYIKEKDYDYIEYSSKFMNTNNNKFMSRSLGWRKEKHEIVGNKCINEDGSVEENNLFIMTFSKCVIDRVLWTTCVKRNKINILLRKLYIDENDYCLYNEDNFLKMIFVLSCNECLYIPDELYIYRRGDASSITGTWACDSLEKYKRKMTNTIMIKYYLELNKIYVDTTDKFIQSFDIYSYINIIATINSKFSGMLINMAPNELKEEMKEYYNKNYKPILEKYIIDL